MLESYSVLYVAIRGLSIMVMICLLALFVGIPVALWLWFRRNKISWGSSIVTKVGGIAYALLATVLIAKGVTWVQPGEVGVVVDMLGSNTGVEDKELHVGMHFLMPWQQVYMFPIYEQNHQWVGEEGFSFQTIEGLSVHADIGITFRLAPDKVHELFWRYRRGMDEITHLFIRNNIRDAVNRLSSKMRIEELYGDKKEEFFIAVQKQVQAELSTLGFDISHLYIIGQLIVPKQVTEALNRKIEAIQTAQQRENELREAEAQAKKEIAKADGEARSTLLRAKAHADATLMEATARAESNKLLTQSLSNELIQWEKVNKWDGVLPKISTGDKGGMMFQLPLEGGK